MSDLSIKREVVPMSQAPPELVSLIAERRRTHPRREDGAWVWRWAQVFNRDFDGCTNEYVAAVEVSSRSLIWLVHVVANVRGWPVTKWLLRVAFFAGALYGGLLVAFGDRPLGAVAIVAGAVCMGIALSYAADIDDATRIPGGEE